MKRLQYDISDSTKSLYNSIIEQLGKTSSKPINVLDLRSSYGINSSLMKYDLTISGLNDFYLNETEPTKKAKQFYEKCTYNENLNFYQIDISEEDLKFSENMNLCKRGINIDLEAEKLELLESFPKIDVGSATGCIGYIGYKSFVNLLKVIKNRQSNYIKSDKEYVTSVFALSVLRMFDMKNIEKVFETYNYSIIKSDIKAIRQRNFSDPKEKAQTISILHNMKINTEKYEDDDNLYADFYIAKSKN